MYFFSFIYNMLKCQKEEKWFCKTQKYELQLLPAACCFHKNELELFREDWPRRHPASPDASGLPAFPSLSAIFFTSFPFSVSSIFQFLFRQLPHTAGNTSRSVFACCQNSTLLLFFRSEVFSFFHKSPRFLPASAGRILPASFLSIHKPEPRAPSCRPLLQIYHTYLTYKSQPLTFVSAGQRHSNYQLFPQTPSRISRCLRATSFPRHFAAAFYSSNIPFFLFSFFHSFSLFFLSSSPFLFFFFFLFLVYSFFFLAFFYPLFCFLFPTLFFLSLFFISITMHVFRVHHPKG